MKRREKKPRGRPEKKKRKKKHNVKPNVCVCITYTLKEWERERGTYKKIPNECACLMIKEKKNL